jgi:hypothetical protein
VTLFSSEEFHRKLAAGDHLLKAVLKGKTISLKGALDELEETASRELGPPTQNLDPGIDRDSSARGT